jgi:hypothetical protein
LSRGADRLVGVVAVAARYHAVTVAVVERRDTTTFAADLPLWTRARRALAAGTTRPAVDLNVTVEVRVDAQIIDAADQLTAASHYSHE